MAVILPDGTVSPWSRPRSNETVKFGLWIDSGSLRCSAARIRLAFCSQIFLRTSIVHSRQFTQSYSVRQLVRFASSTCKWPLCCRVWKAMLEWTLKIMDRRAWSPATAKFLKKVVYLLKMHSFCKLYASFLLRNFNGREVGRGARKSPINEDGTQFSSSNECEGSVDSTWFCLNKSSP